MKRITQSLIGYANNQIDSTLNMDNNLLMDYLKIFVNWEAPLVWALFGAVIGLVGGWFIARHYYKRTGQDLERIRDQLFAKIDESGLSKEEKEHLKAQTAAALSGVFSTYPWEAEFGKGLIGEENQLIEISPPKQTPSKSWVKKGLKGEENSLIE